MSAARLLVLHAIVILVSIRFMGASSSVVGRRRGDVSARCNVRAEAPATIWPWRRMVHCMGKPGGRGGVASRVSSERARLPVEESPDTTEQGAG